MNDGSDWWQSKAPWSGAAIVLGTHRNELTADGCVVSTATIKGGPDVHEVGSDGRSTMTDAPSRAQVIDASTNLIKPEGEGMNMFRLILAALLVMPWTAYSAMIDAGVWTPARTATGALDPADVATLPENEWVAVQGATYNGLRDVIVDAFNAKYGTALSWNNLTVTVGSYVYQAINAWSPGYFDTTRNMICNPTPGGHTAGSVTGTWCWDVARGEWAVPSAPANPSNPRWCDEYRKSYSTTNYPVTCRTGDEPFFDSYLLSDILPDGTPTARHWYGTSAYDEEGDRFVGARGGVWTHNLAADAWHMVIPDGDTKKRVRTMGAAVWNKYEKKLCGLISLKDGDYFGWRCVDPDTGVTSPFAGMISSNCGSRGCTMRLIPGTDEVIAYAANEQQTGEIYTVYNMVTKKFRVSNKPVTGTVYQYDYRNEIPAMTYVPEWLGEDGVRGLWVRINTRLLDGSSCVWSIFNDRTGLQWAYKPDNKPSCSPFVGNKLAYTHLGDVPLLVLTSANSDTAKAVWYMRLGDKAPLYPGEK